MVPMLGDNSEVGAHVWCDLEYLICLRHLYRSKEVKKEQRPISLHTCAKCCDFQSNISTIDEVGSKSHKYWFSLRNINKTLMFKIRLRSYELYWIICDMFTKMVLNVNELFLYVANFGFI